MDSARPDAHLRRRTAYGARTDGECSASMSAGFPIFAGPPTLATFSGTLFTQPTDFHLGMVQQFNVNVERQLPANVVRDGGLCRIAWAAHCWWRATT